MDREYIEGIYYTPFDKKHQENSLTDNILNDFHSKLSYKKLSKANEKNLIKKSKLSFYDEVDDNLKKEYLEYYFEQFPNFRKKYENASKEEKEILLDKAIENSFFWREKFLENNQLLVYQTALKYKKHNQFISKIDLISQGNIGLIKALKDFDVNKDLRFSTYATIKIKSVMQYEFLTKNRTIRIPIIFGNNIYDIIEGEKKLTEVLNRKPSNKELAEYTGLSIKQIEKGKKYIYRQLNPISIDRPYLDGKEMISDLVPSDEDLEEKVEKKIDYEKIYQIINSCNFDENTIRILNLRYGFETGKVVPYNEIAQLLNINQKAIQKIEKEALLIIRQKFIEIDSKCQSRIIKYNEEDNYERKKTIK